MNLQKSYVGYSLGVAVVWTMVLALVSLFAPSSKRHDYYVVFGGFAIGWSSATIARYVYAPPKKHRRTASRAS